MRRYSLYVLLHLVKERYKIGIGLVIWRQLNRGATRGELEWDQDDGGSGRHVELEAVTSVMLGVPFIHAEPRVVASVESLQTSKLVLISLVQNHVWRVPVGADQEILVRIAGVEVENEDKLTALEDDHLVALVREGDELVPVVHDVEQCLHLIHLLVKVEEAWELQILSL